MTQKHYTQEPCNNQISEAVSPRLTKIELNIASVDYDTAYQAAQAQPGHFVMITPKVATQELTDNQVMFSEMFRLVLENLINGKAVLISWGGK